MTKILRLADVKERTGLRSSSIYMLCNEGKFPKKVIIIGRSVGWVESEVDDWIKQRINDRSQAPAI